VKNGEGKSIGGRRDLRWVLCAGESRDHVSLLIMSYIIVKNKCHNTGDVHTFKLIETKSLLGLSRRVLRNLSSGDVAVAFRLFSGWAAWSLTGCRVDRRGRSIVMGVVRVRVRDECCGIWVGCGLWVPVSAGLDEPKCRDLCRMSEIRSCHYVGWISYVVRFLLYLS